MAEEEQLKRIADSLEKMAQVYSDPQAYLNTLEGAMRDLLGRLNVPVSLPQPQTPGIEGAATPVTAAVTAVEVKLSEKERKDICEKAMGDIEEQMTEFKGFIAQALSELPEAQLKRIGDLIKSGKKFKLRRRHGCIYMDFGQGDDDFYLRM